MTILLQFQDISAIQDLLKPYYSSVDLTEVELGNITQESRVCFYNCCDLVTNLSIYTFYRCLILISFKYVLKWLTVYVVQRKLPHEPLSIQWLECLCAFLNRVYNNYSLYLETATDSFAALRLRQIGKHSLQLCHFFARTLWLISLYRTNRLEKQLQIGKLHSLF